MNEYRDENRDRDKENYTISQIVALANIFKKEENRDCVDYIDLKTVDLTKFLTSGIYAQMHLYKKITGNDNIDILEFLAIQTRLVFQDAKVKEEEVQKKPKRGRKKK